MMTAAPKKSSSSVNDAHTNVHAEMMTAAPKKSSSSVNDAHTNVHAEIMYAAPKKKAKISEYVLYDFDITISFYYFTFKFVLTNLYQLFVSTFSFLKI